MAKYQQFLIIGQKLNKYYIKYIKRAKKALFIQFWCIINIVVVGGNRMLKNRKRLIIISGLVGFIIIFGIVTGIHDYNRIEKNMNPIFCIKLEDEKNLNQTCWGLGYKIQQEINPPSDQPFRKTQEFGSWFAKKLKFEYDRGNRRLVEFKRVHLCIDDIKLYYTDDEGTKYYFNCLEEVTINFDDEAISLKKALEKNKITIDEIIGNLILDETYEDGGSTMYKDNEQEYSTGIAVLKCNTTDGNKDVYIGNTAMKYEKNYCK